MNKFGDLIKQLREQNNLLQRQIASKLDIDTPMLSKIERGERKAKRAQVLLFAEILGANKDRLLTLWLADKLYEIVKNENTGTKALKVAEQECKYSKTTTSNN